ncbi:enoyl-CoA hydratase domain-containing protein 3, mitochondrial-like [Antedon mediterranea]|uniref:enoyl-CoA hydratase domain-containing protein 3, mitochondrial-like n=1 Tax=Antedon mediterranea TaxID=105859 RepID=UPI003AF987BF
MALSMLKVLNLTGFRVSNKLFRQYSNTSSNHQYTISSLENGIKKIFLNDLKKRNALSLSMLNSLKSDLLEDAENEELRVIILSSAGPVFCSGHDLKELTSKEGRDYHTQVFDRCSEVMMLVQDIPVPVIAQVQGLATAAGCQLVASCDIAVAADNSRFATPGVNVGLFCSTPGVALGRAVPRKVAMEMLFTGEPITAEVALRHGLVSRVVPEAELEEQTLQIAQKICKASRSVTALGKACFNGQMTKDRNSAYRQASQVMVENLGLRDGQEGIDAFIKKRKPEWQHGFEKAPEQ